MIWKLAVIFGLLGGIWSGFDGLRVNINSPDVYEITMRALEKSGIKNERYLRIEMAMQGNQVVYNYREKTNQVESILFPIYDPFRFAPEILDLPLSSVDTLSAQHFQSLLGDHASEYGTAYAVVKQSISGVSVDNFQAYWDDYSKNSFEGIVRVGWDALESGDKKLLREAGILLVEDFVYIELDTKPRRFVVNLFLMIGCGVGLVFAIWYQYNVWTSENEDHSKLPWPEGANDALARFSELQVSLQSHESGENPLDEQQLQELQNESSEAILMAMEPYVAVLQTCWEKNIRDKERVALVVTETYNDVSLNKALEGINTVWPLTEKWE
jgi:hypothetical protein